ncbi:GNAT family N-acetyltransferase [Bacillus sp. DJP31]|uniref:GNAT family N-acetyltransferase n=1 Tax=Bacillus sp. DJP31 TaxID=3409789 RepID=UPI003BB510C0
MQKHERVEKGDIHIKEIDITNPRMAQEILNIQIPSYEVEAELIDFYEIPPLQDTVDKLTECGETSYGYCVKEELRGVISIKVDKADIDIHRLMVHTQHFRKGIAKKLLEFIEDSEEGMETIIVSTGSKNAPAVNLYGKSGFLKTGETRVTEQLTITSFKKKVQ